MSNSPTDVSTRFGSNGPASTARLTRDPADSGPAYSERFWRSLSSIKARLFIWTVEYVVLVQLVLFIVLLSVFERYQLENSVEKSDLIGQLAVRMIDSNTAGTGDAVGQTLVMLREQYGVEPLSYKAGDNERSFQFTDNAQPEVGNVSAEIDLAELGPADYFINAVSRLFEANEGTVLIRNADHFLPVEDELGSRHVVIKGIGLDAAKLRSGTLGFMIAYLLQASVLMLIVAVMMYLTGNRQIAAPLKRLKETVGKLAEDPVAQSGALTVSGSVVEEIHETEGEVRNLMKTIRVEGVKAFLNYRGEVEHDVKDALIVQNLIALEIGQATDGRKISDLVDRLTDMQHDTMDFLNDIFDFVALDGTGRSSAAFSLHEFCRDLLGRNVHLITEGCEQEYAVVENLLCARARIDVPQDLRVRVDRTALKSAIENLVRNSVKAFRKPGRLAEQRNWNSNLIEISAREHEDGIVISVRDNGPGFAIIHGTGEQPASEREGVFRKSWGIGLEIVKERIRGLGGKFEIRENPAPPRGAAAAGAEVRITFPRLETQPGYAEKPLV